MQNKIQATDRLDTLRHTLPAKQYVLEDVDFYASPFKKNSLWRRGRAAFKKGCISILESFTKRELYVENTLHELAQIRPVTRRLLSRLISEGIITHWRYKMLPAEQPSCAACNLSMKKIPLPSGEHAVLYGAAGNGVGWTLDEALVPALGELLERYSTVTWDETTIVTGSYKQLKNRGAVNPIMFSHFTQSQLALDDFALFRVTEDTELDWIRGQDFISGRPVLVPAQMVYIFYGRAYPKKKRLGETSTNATAAGSNYAMASTNAILEAIERDAFMIFWMNRISPPQVDISTIDIPEIKALLNYVTKTELTFRIVDLTTDIEVPVLAGVVLDERGAPAVTISAVAGMDLDVMMRKLALEVMKFITDPMQKRSKPAHMTAEQVRGIEDRRIFWSDREMISHALFLCSGQSYAYSELRNRYPVNTTRLEYLRDVMRKKNIACYLVDVTNKTAHEAGLVVVRAMLPELVPIYFNENTRPEGVLRLYEVPAALGYKGARNDSELNPIPHPFL